MTVDTRLGRPFLKLWAATAASSLGDGMLVVALPLLATTVTKDERLIAAVAVAETAPWLLFAVLAGTIADRRSYRQVLVFSDLVRAVILGLVAVLTLTSSLSMTALLVASFGLGTLKPAFDAAAYRAVPSVVPDAALGRANGYLDATISTSDEIVGRALGGILYSVSASVPLVGDAVSFLLSAIVLRTLPPDTPLVDPDAPRPTIVADMLAGFRWFLTNRVIRLLTAMVAVLALAQAMVFAVLVVIAQRRFGLSGSGFGVLFASISVGGVFGSLAANRLCVLMGRTRLFISAIGLVALLYWVAWLVTSPVAFAVALSLQVAAISAASVTNTTFRQQIIPREVIGRVGNVIRTFTWGALPLGSAIGGLLAHRFGLRSPLLVASVVSSSVFVVALALLPSRLAQQRATDGAVLAASVSL